MADDSEIEKTSKNNSDALQTSVVAEPRGLSLVYKLLGSNDSFNLEAEWNNSLIPIPWAYNDALCIPYGRADVPFLNRLLYNANWIVVSKSLHALIERAYDTLKAVDILRVNAIDSLKKLLLHEEPFVRQRCCVLIKVLGAQPLGKMTTLNNKRVVENLLDLMADDDYRVRFHCAMTVLALAEQRMGNETMAECGFVERVLGRVYDEQDVRVVPALLRTVGGLMATNSVVQKRIAQRDLRLFMSKKSSTAEATGALAETLDGNWLASRGILEYLKWGARSSDYRVVLDCVVCMSSAATVLESKVFLAERTTMDLLMTFALAPSMKCRALRAFSLQLLCTLAETTYGQKYVLGQKDSIAALSAIDDPACRNYVKRLVGIMDDTKL